MKILILGGTSFIGPFLIRGLSAQGHAVHYLHRGQHMPDEKPANAKAIYADMNNLGPYKTALQQMKFDVVVNMIALDKNDAWKALDTFAGHAGRIVVASSQDVYAAFGALLRKEQRDPPAANLAIDESGDLRKSRHIHGGTYEKIDVEEAFLARSSELPATIIRIPATYGPNDARQRFFPYVKRFDDARPAIVLEPAFANFRWTHAYVENVAHALVLAATNEQAAGRIYNIGAPKTLTTGERLHALARAAGYRGQIIVAPRDHCPPHLVKDIDFRHDVATNDTAIRRELGYDERVELEEGLKRTIAWQRTVCPVEIKKEEFDYAAEDAFLRTVGLVN